MSAKAMRRQGRDGSRVTPALGGSFSESVLSMAGTNTPSLVGLQNWASEHSCVAAAIQVEEMLAGVRAVELPEGYFELPNAETCGVLPRGVGSGPLEAQPSIQQSAT